MGVILTSNLPTFVTAITSKLVPSGTPVRLVHQVF